MRARSPVRADAAIVAFITQRTVIERCLAHLAQRAARASSRPGAQHARGHVGCTLLPNPGPGAGASTHRSRAGPARAPTAPPAGLHTARPERTAARGTLPRSTAPPRGAIETPSDTSDALLAFSMEEAVRVGAEAKTIRLAELKFRACEGYYSKSAHACTWPCSITQMDPDDQLDGVYEALVHWADVILVATPIRWGSASSLYFKMVERMNCVQNQVTIANRVLMRNKVASFIITGGQDSVQAVAGQMLGFFGEIGCHFPQFPYIAHSRGWTAEDMENNVADVMHSADLRDGAKALAARAIDHAKVLIEHEPGDPKKMTRGGRKAHRLARD